MGVSDLVRALSKSTGFSQPIIKRFASVCKTDQELRQAVRDHSNPELLGMCPCPLCGGAPRVSLKHDGTPMSKSVPDSQPGNAVGVHWRVASGLGVASSGALLDRSMRPVE